MSERPDKVYLGKSRMKEKTGKDGKVYKTLYGPNFGFGYIEVDVKSDDEGPIFYWSLVQSKKKEEPKTRPVSAAPF